jgi:hypothetical protein
MPPSPIFRDFFKFGLFAVAAIAFLTHPASATQPADISLIDKERNIANLNARNLSETRYTLPPPSTEATQFRFALKGYVFGLRMIRANYSGWYDQTNYAVYADIKTSGLGALLKKLEIWAVTLGQNNRTNLKPIFHVQQNLDKKNRRVEMNYTNPAGPIDVKIIPTLGSQGIPPASPEERFAADDTLSAILNLMMRGWGDKEEICDGTIKVFDSKQHYGLRMEPSGTKRLKFDGQKFDALSCDIYYEPISGFDPEDLPENEESATPVKVYFQHRPEIGLYIPIRFTYKISAIKAVIVLDEAQIIIPREGFVRKLND